MSANAFISEVMSQGGWFRQLRCLVKELGFEMSGFLHFLIDYQIRHANGREWFYCTAKQIENEVGISCKVQTKLLNRLAQLELDEEQDGVEEKDRKGLIEFRKMGLPCKRHIRIDYDKFMNLVEKASNAQMGVTSEEGDSLVTPDWEPVQTSNRASPSIYKRQKEKETNGGDVSSPEVKEVVDHYRSRHKRSRPGDKEKRKIRDRLKEGYSVADLKAAIDGNYRSEWHAGENERGRTYQTLELIMRDSSHVDQFMKMAEGGSSSGEEYKPPARSRFWQPATGMTPEEQDCWD